MTGALFDLTDAAISAIAEGLARAHGEAEGVAETLAALEQQDRSRPAGPPPQPRQDTACRHLPAALAMAQAVDGTVAAALSAVVPLLSWHRIPDHVPHPPGPFMDDYAYAQIFGPQGVYPGEDFMMGLFVIGPQQFYPAHLHAAPELYWLLAGPNEWCFGDDEPWVTKQAGALRWNRPFQSHAMRTGAAPFFAFWAWPRDIEGDYRIVGAEWTSPLNRPRPN